MLTALLAQVVCLGFGRWPFEHAWFVVDAWLVDEPTVTAEELMKPLAAMVPDVCSSKAQLRTLQRRIKAWRAEKAKGLILGRLRTAAALTEAR